MKVKIFHALTMQDAMRAIKAELGPEAIILSSKEVREGGRLLRVFNRPVLEIMAAAEQEVQQPHQLKNSWPPGERPAPAMATPPPSPVAMQTFQQTLQAILQPNQERGVPSEDQQSPPSRTACVGTKRPEFSHLRSVKAELTRLIQDLSTDNRHAASRPLSPFLVSMRRTLLARGIHPTTVECLINEAHATLIHEQATDNESTRDALQRAIARRVTTSPPWLDERAHPSISLLLGPSGAGTTSAVAKVAAYYRSEHRKSAALISFDTFRETAVEQLRRHARAVGVPFACALSARQVSEGLRRHTRGDLVLIDMPGIGPDALRLAKELHRLLPEGAIATHVVLPACIGSHEARRIIRRIEDLPRPRLLFTKLDEADSFATIFDVAQQSGIPLSYWSLGRRVPGDLEVASAERLAVSLTAQGSDDLSAGSRQAIHASVTTPAMTGVGTHHG